MLLKNRGISSKTIGDCLQLWSRAFLTWKTYKISLKKLWTLFLNLIEIDKKMKFWKLLWSDSNDLFYELEKAVFKNI
jgi:hypothetical protein